MNSNIKRICAMSIFCALSVASLFLIKFKASFLTFDLKDVFICIGAMLTGPFDGILIALISSIVEMLTLSDTGIYGLLMNFISSSCFAFTAAMIYKKKRTGKGAVLGLTVSSLSVTLVMLLFNLLITPLYLKTDIEEVMKIIPTLLLPFNLIKYFLNSSIIMLIYKPISNAMKRTGLIKGKTNRDAKTSLLMWLLTVVIIVICLISLYVFLNGSLVLFN